ncbi:DUF2752 domain-containing protein [Kaistella yonginensis]|uniref:DUF2752 domain-containing protein n=1 Tax=Kaistella yonginensis TaxID=658267 RepID=UPI0025B60083|nr:DUF2752 domain-containing protein [Kaistella yonginensis]MDN3606068.1 DUF2752 domain-containing protein [Kaistella yonginensis]
MTKKNIPLGIYFTLAILLGLTYYFYHPAHYQLFPKCVFKSVTGLSCPGCGTQRATHELLHFNFKSAFSYNALLVVSLPLVLVGLLFHQTRLKEQFPKINNFLFSSTALVLMFIVVILFFIFRNL